VLPKALLKALRRQKGINDNNDLDTSQVTITSSDLSAALATIRPSVMREVAVEVPKVLWTEIGGQAMIKQKLKEVREHNLILLHLMQWI